YSMLLTFVLFLMFYFWEFPFYQLISIALKSILVTILYVYLNYKFDISPDINKVIDMLLRKVGIKI
ncbi:lipopolysaccharide biosynthesis protein, partial [Flavobacterium sp. LBUM151]